MGRMEGQKAGTEMTQRPNNQVINEEQKVVVSLVFRLKVSNRQTWLLVVFLFAVFVYRKRSAARSGGPDGPSGSLPQVSRTLLIKIN